MSEHNKSTGPSLTKEEIDAMPLGTTIIGIDISVEDLQNVTTLFKYDLDTWDAKIARFVRNPAGANEGILDGVWSSSDVSRHFTYRGVHVVEVIMPDDVLSIAELSEAPWLPVPDGEDE